MPEGPSIRILQDELAPFSGKKVLEVAGTEKSFDLQMLKNKTVRFRTWGKHFLICGPGFTVRVHFMLFGSWLVNDRKKARPRLHLRFRNGEVNFYAGSVKWLPAPPDEVYDWSADLLNGAWSPRKATAKLKQVPDMLVADALLDQNIFAGAGNIFKNEVPWRARVHPGSRVGALPPRKRSELVKDMHAFALDFLHWKKAGVLKKNWNVHTKSECPRCHIPLHKEYLGKTRRRTFYCEKCQKKYT